MADEVIKDGENVSSKKRWIPVIIAGVVVFGLLIWGGVDQRRQQKLEEARVAEEQRLAKDSDSDEVDYAPGSDYYLLEKQDSLTSKYGTSPDGYLWDYDGSLLSLGDTSMSAEDVVYAYFNGLSSLDFSTVQKYSRKSRVAERFSSFFDKNTGTFDYSSNFSRDMYRMALLSLQPKEIVNTTVFAENKQVFTIKVSMLDLTQKEFWFDDKAEIYKNLQVFKSDQSDQTKADMYLYEYISSYYSSEDALRRDVIFDITLQKYPDLNTGWLVSIDDDVDMACRYANGTLITNYIKQEFTTEGRDFLASLGDSDE